MKNDRGHTLLELMIAMALGMLIVVAALSLYRSQRAAFERAADIARIHDAGVVALDLLGQQIQMAGFAAGNDRVDAALIGCAQGRVIGADTSSTCETLASRSDGMQVRYLADTIATWASTTNSPTDCLGQNVADAYVINRYYARASTSSGEPELYCEGSGKQAQPLVEGIERMRVVYWLPGATSAVDASAVARDRWADINAVELCVLVRGYLNQAKRKASYIDCSGAIASAEDGRTRQAFWRRIAIRNLTTRGAT
jgi:type IV pilus assembly protein PilW